MNKHAFRLTAFALPVCLIAACTLPLSAQTSPSAGVDPDTAALLTNDQPVRAPHAMVVTVQHCATDAGVEILKAGGNAVDSAVAVGFALAVVYPFAGNIGGGGFMLIHQHSAFVHGHHGDREIFLDYREKAPRAATPNMYLDASGNIIPKASIVGYRAIGVPGSVAGLVYAERNYGRLTLEKVMAPAIRLATDGFVLTDQEAAMLHDPLLAQFPASRKIFQRDDDFYKPGDTFKQPELAQTLRRIAENPDDFYHGAMASQIAQAVKQGGGLITANDLAQYTVKERKPIDTTYRGFDVISSPPPSSGGVTLAEMLNILEGYNLTPLHDRTAQEMHLIIEAFRRAFMDRNEYLGDPDYVKMPIDKMISRPYADAWRATINPDKATPSADLQRPAGFLPPPPTMADVHQEPMNTTHYSVMDADGNAVSVTTTLNNGFGSGVTVSALGFLLNDEMDDFASKQGVPNMFGLIQGPANSIAPGKRPLSSMTPTIVLHKGKVILVDGSPGGATIISTVANILISVLDQDLNIQQAVDAPRFHQQYLPDVVMLERGFSDETVNGLRSMGYTLRIGHHWGDGECIELDPYSGQLEGGQDHRHNFGKAAGY